MAIDGVRGRAFVVERSEDVRAWNPLDLQLPETNGSGPLAVVDEETTVGGTDSVSRGYYRLRFRDLVGP